MRRRWWGLGLAAAWLGAAGAALDAHPAYLTAAEITVEPDGAFHGQVRFDTLAFVLNDTSVRIGNEPMESLLAGPPEALAAQLAGARGRFARAFRVVTDAGDGTVEALDFPAAEDVLRWARESRPVLPVVVPVGVSGRLPPTARTVAARFPPVLERVILTVERPGEEPEAEPVETGAVSTALPIELATPSPASGGEIEARAAAKPMQGNRLIVSLAMLLLLSLLGIFGWWRRG